MSHSHECPCGRPRAGCEYHDPALQAPIPITVPPGTKLPTSEDFAREWAAAHPHLVGRCEPCESDFWGDPEDPNNPRAYNPYPGPSASAPASGVTIGGLHLQRSDYLRAEVDVSRGERFRIALPLGSEREVKTHAMLIADKMCTHRAPFIALDAPALQVRTDRAWFESRHVDIATVTYVLRFVP